MGTTAANQYALKAIEDDFHFIEAGTQDIEEADSAWIYDTAPGAGLGQLHVEDLMLSAGTTPIRRTYAYDGFGRSSSVTSEITRGAGIETYTEATTYDEYGRVFQRFDASGNSAGFEYVCNGNGDLASAHDSRDSDTANQPGAKRAHGQTLVCSIRHTVESAPPSRIAENSFDSFATLQMSDVVLDEPMRAFEK